MKRYFCTHALLSSGWKEQVLIDVNSDGYIESIKGGEEKPAHGETIQGWVIPSMANLHSHAFQRGMAGLAEVAGNPQDSFWTWREQMYSLVNQLTPGQVGVIASYLYLSMLKGGYTQVAEFNYLHHDPRGNPYSEDLMAAELMRAAQTAGIGQTLLPVLYTYSGFGSQPATSGQKRFIQSTESYLNQFSNLEKQMNHPLNQLGICFHSLRAVSIEQISQVRGDLSVEYPVHIHIAEQMKEVNDCLGWSGQRPVSYLADRVDLDSRWCLVHGTHLDEGEIRRIAQSGAVVGICPTTEANLGDGLFPAVEYFEKEGRWGVGSDSHVSLSALEELRWLEYGQRLIHQKRNRLVSRGNPVVGEVLWEQAARGGAQACGVKMGQLAPGMRADWLVLADDEWLGAVRDEQRMNRWLFAGTTQEIRDVYVAGTRVIEQGRHPREEELNEQFARVMSQLIS